MPKLTVAIWYVVIFTPTLVSHLLILVEAG